MLLDEEHNTQYLRDILLIAMEYEMTDTTNRSESHSLKASSESVPLYSQC